MFNKELKVFAVGNIYQLAVFKLLHSFTIIIKFGFTRVHFLIAQCFQTCNVEFYYQTHPYIRYVHFQLNLIKVQEVTKNLKKRFQNPKKLSQTVLKMTTQICIVNQQKKMIKSTIMEVELKRYVHELLFYYFL